jgi:SAM-dependent methyltransferase
MAASEKSSSTWSRTPEYSRSVGEATYDRIGVGYGEVRRPDPRIAARIEEALGDARSVLNVGAGTGSYEPGGREVTAVEPSAEMIAQRPAGSAPVVQASAEELPFEDGSFDAAMAVLTVHHWADAGAGLREMRRVARQRVLVVAFDPSALVDLWITRDYFPEMLRLKRRSPGSGEQLAAILEGARSEPLPVPRDCHDLFFAALWARPEMLFDEEVVRPMWVWQSISEEARQEGRERLAGDLESGAWDERYGHLREMEELDVGLRLVIAEL